MDRELVMPAWVHADAPHSSPVMIAIPAKTIDSAMPASIPMQPPVSITARSTRPVRVRATMVTKLAAAATAVLLDSSELFANLVTWRRATEMVLSMQKVPACVQAIGVATIVPFVKVLILKDWTVNSVPT